MRLWINILGEGALFLILGNKIEINCWNVVWKKIWHIKKNVPRYIVGFARSCPAIPTIIWKSNRDKNNNKNINDKNN